ncbi:uncharacterized protein LOC123674767 isoform X1 [Harmonia axyridis]|uniref:uncharacterized protein LOC123674767 isoform X1 n=1 Tax=Harmonia axyridis TaxID=115357 RepID=UPI001E277F12|nr:uncharacterized protein LOC123674767 isoform X1 [Harmonia axyridis]
MNSNKVALLLLIAAIKSQKTSGELSDSTSRITTPSGIEITQQTVTLSTSLSVESISNNFNYVTDPTSTKTTEKLFNSAKSPSANTKATAELLSRSEDFNEDFIHFVLTAIRRSQTKQISPSNEQKAATIIKKLISLIPRHQGTEPSIKNTSPVTNTNLNQLGVRSHHPSSAVMPRSKIYKANRITYRNNFKELSKNEDNDATTQYAIKDNKHELNEYESYGTKHPALIKVTTMPQKKSVPFRSSGHNTRRLNEEFVHKPLTSQSTGIKYSFTSDIQDEINGNLHKRQESREGNKVSGSYTYEDGYFRRTVYYIADEKGYRVIREDVKEIGDGPLYNPEGSAKFHANIAGKKVDYQITTRDIMRMPELNYHQDYNPGYDWSY